MAVRGGPAAARRADAGVPEPLRHRAVLAGRALDALELDPSLARPAARPLRPRGRRDPVVLCKLHRPAPRLRMPAAARRAPLRGARYTARGRQDRVAREDEAA